MLSSEEALNKTKVDWIVCCACDNVRYSPGQLLVGEWIQIVSLWRDEAV